MRCLAPAVTAATAWRRLARRRFERTRRALRAMTRRAGARRGPLDADAPPRSPGRVPYLETVWLPHFLVTLRAEAADGNKSREHALLVGAHDRHVRFINLADAAWQTSADGSTFTAGITADEACDAALRYCVAHGARGRGWTAPSMEVSVDRAEPVGYPYWVYYFARRGDMLDFHMLDAWSGSPAGPKAKAALLAALAARRAAASHTTSSSPTIEPSAERST